MTLAYGVCVGPSGDFEKFALPGIRAMDPAAPIFVRRGQNSIFEAYNSIIDEVAHLNVDGLVLIHDDVMIRDADFARKVTSLFEDPSIGIVGVIGASDVKSLEWWWSESRGRVRERGRTVDFGTGTFDVDVVDGLLIAMSSIALEILRFDESFPGFHGYDADIGMQAKSRGLRVVVADIDVYHDSVPGQITNQKAYLRAGVLWRSKWRSTRANRFEYIRFISTKKDLRLRQRLTRIAGTAGPALEGCFEVVERLVKRDLSLSND